MFMSKVKIGLLGGKAKPPDASKRWKSGTDCADRNVGEDGCLGCL